MCGLRCCGRHGLAVDQDLARAQRPDAGERLEQLRLAVAGDAGHAEDLAFAQDERNAVDASDAAVVAHHEIPRLERDSARMSGALVDLEDHLAPDHRVGELGRRGHRRFEVATISPRRITETRSVRLMISRSLWVMKMIVLFSRLSTRSISNN